MKIETRAPSTSVSPAAAWHYTGGLGFAGIVESGRVDLSRKDVPAGEIPVCWFSSNPVLERTLRETAYGLPDGTVLRPKTLAEFRILSMGLYRIEMPVDSLIRYADGVKIAGISLARRRLIEKIARKVGGYPHDWYVSFSPVSLDEAPRIETFDGSKWLMLERDKAMAYAQSEQAQLVPLIEEMIRARRGRGRAR